MPRKEDFASIGISCIAMDYRKECRRKGGRCAPFTDDEVLVHGLATVAEITIAQRLYGIKIASAIAISHSTRREEQINDDGAESIGH
uniref:Uncharacterized protein n=1 Tax=Bionectria ochroleuca TaxID=29856 RepID=A0A0B7JPU8_BIOOC